MSQTNEKLSNVNYNFAKHPAFSHRKAFAALFKIDGFSLKCYDIFQSLTESKKIALLREYYAEKTIYSYLACLPVRGQFNKM